MKSIKVYTHYQGCTRSDHPWAAIFYSSVFTDLNPFDRLVIRLVLYSELFSVIC